MEINEEPIVTGNSAEAIEERYESALDRIRSFPDTLSIPALRDYFARIRELALLCDKVKGGVTKNASLNALLYDECSPEGYMCSYLNPDYCAAKLGSDIAPILCAWYSEFRGIIPFIYEGRILDAAAILETTIQLFNLLDGTVPDTDDNAGDGAAAGVPKVSGSSGNPGISHASGTARALSDIVSSYIYDYADQFVSDFVYRDLCCTDSFAKKIVMESDLTDTGENSYLYSYGEWVTGEELGTARLMASLSKDTVERMASAYTDGYIRGFALTGKDIKSKSTVVCYMPLGFERFMRAAIRQFEAQGLKAILNRNPVHLINKKLRGNIRPGFYGAFNRQCEYDHKEDMSLFWNEDLLKHKLTCLKEAYEANREALSSLSGNACVEIFGLESKELLLKQSAPRYSDQQLKLNREYTYKSHGISSRYVPDKETSFTIIAWPTPSIADRFLEVLRSGSMVPCPDISQTAYREIFEKVIEINTLPTDSWQRMQQHIIDALDRADTVEVKGSGSNETSILVKLHKLSDPSSETNFENCLADVNIPAGEVFTSPVLEGTNGLLHAGYVYIEGHLFRNLKLFFENGRVADYSCSNYEDPAAGRRLVEKVIFSDRKALPLGEFAIGTNTTAYAASKKYMIGDKLPVLIAEKTGPHFAVGDTCYVYEEDMETFNPDGKKITARENECSALRHQDPEHAYFSVHCDITLPYEELGSLTAVNGEERTDIIRNGRFVLPGTEELNKALDGM